MIQAIYLQSIGEHHLAYVEIGAASRSSFALGYHDRRNGCFTVAEQRNYVLCHVALLLDRYAILVELVNFLTA